MGSVWVHRHPSASTRELGFKGIWDFIGEVSYIKGGSHIFHVAENDLELLIPNAGITGLHHHASVVFLFASLRTSLHLRASEILNSSYTHFPDYLVKSETRPETRF